MADEFRRLRQDVEDLKRRLALLERKIQGSGTIVLSNTRLVVDKSINISQVQTQEDS